MNIIVAIFQKLILMLVLSLAIIVIKEITFLIKYYKDYKDQKISLFYYPILGWLKLILPPKNRSANWFEYYKKIINSKLKNEKIVAFNQNTSTEPMFFILDPNLISEFFCKEVEYTVKGLPVKLPQDLGFIMEGGEGAMKKRAIFNNFFKHENLEKITGNIVEIVRRNYKNLEGEIWKEKGDENKREFRRYDLRNFYPKVMSDIVNSLLFGDTNFPFINKKSLPETNQEIMDDFAKNILQSLFNALTSSIFHNKDILPASRALKKRVEKVEKEILKTIKLREKVEREKRGLNILDVMLNFNDTSDEKEKLTYKEMISNVFLFQFAGFDTTKNITEMTMKYFSVRNEDRERFVNEELKKIYGEEGREDYYSFFKSDFLTGFISEVMRFNPVLPISIDRKLVKDMRLGDFKLKKGSGVIIPYYGLHNNQNNFKDFEVFRPDRYMEKDFAKNNRNCYIPFNGGRRACIGKNFAEIVMRVLVCEFFKKFEMKKIEGEEFRNCLRLVCGTEDCVVEFRVKE